MPRKPNATRPNEKAAGASMTPGGQLRETRNALPMRPTIAIPIQYALKLPAVRPERTFKDAPPSRDAVTISRTCRDSVDVKTLTSSGMTAPASVPHVMIVASFHQSVPSPSSGMMARDIAYVITIETTDVIQTRLVSGASKFILSAAAYRAFAITPLIA